MKTLITPELAKKMLEKNTINREINKAGLEFLVNEMTENRFKYNGESIIVSKNGNLMDGQHRLLAIVKSGVSVYINIVDGIEEETMSTIDTGTVRTAASVFSLNGIKSSNYVSAITKQIITKQDTNRRHMNGKKIKESNQELFNFFNMRKETISSMYLFCQSLNKSNLKVMSITMAASYLYLFSLEDKRAKNFIRELYNGNQETSSNAAIKLRDKLANSKISAIKFSKQRERDLVIYCWRKYILGENIKVFRNNLNMSFLRGNINELNSKLLKSDFE